jgi:uncharacterized protein (UPF0264 family)
VSVRSATEALAALAGGADVIDVKEPSRGPLGAADPHTIAETVRVVAGRVPVTVAMGELLDLSQQGAKQAFAGLPAGVSYCKFGLSGCSDLRDWQTLWAGVAIGVCRAATNKYIPVAVVYADWQSARAPQPADVLRAAAKSGCGALLVDTWNKSSGDLFEHWRANDANELSDFIRQVREHHMAIVLAGSLHGPAITAAAQLAPDLVAVRGAACDHGRGGAVNAHRVAAAKKSITTAGTALSRPAAGALPVARSPAL